MKKLSLILLILSLFLVSCAAEDTPPADTFVETGYFDENLVETTEKEEAETTEKEEPLPCLVGFYDELTVSGTYTRLSEWNQPWVLGKDIAVFDVIPSSEETLTGRSYKALWTEQSDKISAEEMAKPYFVLEYTLKDGTVKTQEIRSYAEAEAVIDEGYLEVYLYDDIHQNGGWYYHLTESTTNEDTVISSFKLTAGKEIYSVMSIKLTAYIEGSSGATIEINNGIN